jgi:hypothetical protein
VLANEWRVSKVPAMPVWLLAVAAFVAGAAIAAAVFVTVWRHEARRSTTAQAQVSSRDAEIRVLRANGDGLARRLAADTLALRRLQARAAAAVKARDAARAQASGAAAAAKQARAEAASVRATAQTLASDLQGLSAYFSQTSAAAVDPSYVATQLAYLKKLASALAR